MRPRCKICGPDEHCPGEVAHFLQYSVPRLPALFAEAEEEAQAQALSNMSDPTMFEGLTESERTGIRNFQVPGL